MVSNIVRKFTLALGVLAACPVAVLSQSYPNKPIRLIVPFPAGGGVDFIGRIVGQKLSERLGQQVPIDNRAGANGIVGLEILKASPPDGYTIAAASAGPLAVNPFIYSKLPYDALRDFVGITPLSKLVTVLTVHSSMPTR